MFCLMLNKFLFLQLVIQLAKAKGIHTVNVVRDRPDMAKVWLLSSSDDLYYSDSCQMLWVRKLVQGASI